MVALTRRIALQIRSVLRRAFGSRAPGLGLAFTADAGTLIVRAVTADAAVEYRGHVPDSDGRPSADFGDTLWVPFTFLVDCGAKSDEAVTLQSVAGGGVVARWQTGNIPRTVQYDCPSASNAEFPSMPETTATNPCGLLPALAEAARTTDSASVRFALGHIQLRGGTGTVAATDGRQLLLQSGFRFPWEGDILVPASKLFASAELAGHSSVAAGRSEKWFTLAPKQAKTVSRY